MTEIYLHIDARMADYIRTHPYDSTTNPRASVPLCLCVSLFLVESRFLLAFLCLDLICLAVARLSKPCTTDIYLQI
eukprot:COSAG05_NODE_579_length_8556_cov_44.773679_18_plen_76_part_00